MTVQAVCTSSTTVTQRVMEEEGAAKVPATGSAALQGGRG